MSTGCDLQRLEQIVERSGQAQLIEALLPIGPRPRQLSVRTLLLGMLLSLCDGRPAHLVRVHQALQSLPEADRRRLGVIGTWREREHELTYRQVEYTFALITGALAKKAPDGKPSQLLSEVIDALLEASVQVLGAPASSALAVDWTDFESFARPPRKGEKQGGERMILPSADPEGAWGHRNTNHPGKADLFFGYFLQAVTMIREEDGQAACELVRRITLCSCEHDPPGQIVAVLERMAQAGIPLGDLLCDSGYSYRQADQFAVPLRGLGAALVFDLHPNDRGQKGTHQGAIICNGNLYCPATPKALFELGPLAPGASQEQADAHERKCSELARHKLSPLTAVDGDGYRRLICPAVAGKLRCPLRAASLELSFDRPTVCLAAEHPPLCCSQQTITLAGSVVAKSAQKHDYPSRAHRRSYARRSAAERSFAQLFDPAALNLSRGFSRLLGLAPNALFVACAVVAANIRLADASTARMAAEKRRGLCGSPARRRSRRGGRIPAAHGPSG